MNAAIYLRTSKKDQQPENQRADIERYCKEHDLNITGEYVDQESAYRGNQHELARLLKELRTGIRKYDALVVYALDRLSRGGGLALLQSVSNFAKVGVKVVSVKESGITDLPTDLQEAFMPVLAFYANYDSKRKSQNVKIGQDFARKHGTKSGVGIGKRGKDKHPRFKGGYRDRYARQKDYPTVKGSDSGTKEPVQTESK